MPAVQTVYNERMAKAAAGMRANMTNDNVVTRICETVAGIGFGLAVSQGAGDKGAVLGGADSFNGISVRDVTVMPAADGTTDKYRRYANMSVMTLGDIWVKAKGTVNADDPVYWDATTGELSATDTTDSVGPVAGARWKTSATNGLLAIVTLGIQK